MKQAHCIDTIQLARRPPAFGLVGWMRRLPDQVLMGLERSRQRRQLGELDRRMLRDIGVSPSAAFSETRKWFWQP
jgi:Domain of unknown function (DUF1127)